MANQFLVYQLDWRRARIADAALDDYDNSSFNGIIG
jgi:hypothetical protein